MKKVYGTVRKTRVIIPYRTYKTTHSALARQDFNLQRCLYAHHDYWYAWKAVVVLNHKKVYTSVNIFLMFTQFWLFGAGKFGCLKVPSSMTMYSDLLRDDVLRVFLSSSEEDKG